MHPHPKLPSWDYYSQTCRWMFVFSTQSTCVKRLWKIIFLSKRAVGPYLQSGISSPWHAADSTTGPAHISSVQFVIILAHLLIIPPSLRMCCTEFIISIRSVFRSNFFLVHFTPLSILLSFSLVYSRSHNTHTHTHGCTHTSPSFSCHLRLGMALDRIY